MIKFNGTQTKGAGVFHSTDRGVPVKAVLNTTGDGLWSQQAKKVTVVGMAVEPRWQELKVFFDTKTWNCREHGLIYTDPGFELELQECLCSMGLVGHDVEYSEQGMQGDNYVSLDVGKEFIASWVDKFYNGDHEKFAKDAG